MADAMAANPYMFEEEDEETPEDAFYASLGNAEAELASAPQMAADAPQLPAQEMTPMSSDPTDKNNFYPPEGDEDQWIWDGEKWVRASDDPGPDAPTHDPETGLPLAPPGDIPEGFNPVTAGYVPPPMEGDGSSPELATGLVNIDLDADPLIPPGLQPNPDPLIPDPEVLTPVMPGTVADPTSGTPTDLPVGAYTGQGTIGYGQAFTGQESYLEPYIQNILNDAQAREYQSNTAASMDAANVQQAAGMQAAQVGDLSIYGGATIDPLNQAQAAQMGAMGTQPTGAQVGQVSGPQAAQVQGLAGPQSAQISAQDQAARSAQLQQLSALEAMAGGQVSPVIQQQRDRGTQDVLAMMATQRGVPASAVMRTGMEGMSEVNRQAQEQAAQMQLASLEQLGGAAGQMRGQEIGLASEQAQLDQQGTLTGYEGARQAAMQDAGFAQEASMQTSQMAQQTALTQAGFEQEAQQNRENRIQQRESENAQMRQQTSLANMDAIAQRAAQQAQLQQQAGLAGMDAENQAMLQEAAYQQEANAAIFEAEQQVNLASADFQQQANLTNAELEQQMTIADAQVNAQLEGARDQLMGALIAQGVDRYKAEMQVNAEIQMQYNALMKDYFAIRSGSMVELGTAIIDQQWFNESSTEELRENLNVIYALAGQAAPGAQAPTPGLGSGGQYNISQGIGAYPWSNQQSPWASGGLGPEVDDQSD